MLQCINYLFQKSKYNERLLEQYHKVLESELPTDAKVVELKNSEKPLAEKPLAIYNMHQYFEKGQDYKFIKKDGTVIYYKIRTYQEMHLKHFVITLQSFNKHEPLYFGNQIVATVFVHPQRTNNTIVVCIEPFSKSQSEVYLDESIINRCTWSAVDKRIYRNFMRNKFMNDTKTNDRTPFTGNEMELEVWKFIYDLFWNEHKKR